MPTRHISLPKVILLIVGAVASYAATAHFMQGIAMPSFRRNYLALWMVCVLMAWFCLVFRRGIRRVAGSIAAQLSQMARSGEISPVSVVAGDDFGNITRPLNSFLDSTKIQIEQLNTLNQDLRIRFRVALEEKQDIEAVIHSMSEPVIVTSCCDELVLANRPAQKLLKIQMPRAIRPGLDSVISDPKLVGAIQETRRNGWAAPAKTIEHRIESGGVTKTFNVRLNCIRGLGDETCGVVAVLHDVTQEKEIAEMKTDFVSNVTHELKTPLATIKAYAELLMDGEGGEGRSKGEFYKIIFSETERLQRMIENVLSVARIESGLIGLKRQEIDVSRVVQRVLHVASLQAKMKGIEISTDLADSGSKVEAEADLIYQCVLNLISNAIKYTCRGGRIAVKVSVDEPRSLVRCEVTDTGVGIPAEDMPRVFEKFFRSPANDAMAEGTGIGLAMVKYIVESIYAGRVFATSEVGEGSSFGFELSLVRRAAEATSESVGASAR